VEVAHGPAEIAQESDQGAGPERQDNNHLHEYPWAMVLPNIFPAPGEGNDRPGDGHTTDNQQGDDVVLDAGGDPDIRILACRRAARGGDERDQEGEYATDVEEDLFGQIYPAQCDHGCTEADETSDKHRPGWRVEVRADGAKPAVHPKALIDHGRAKGHQQPHDPHPQVTIGLHLIADIRPHSGCSLVSRIFGHLSPRTFRPGVTADLFGE
jgi:hypothetical protein